MSKSSNRKPPAAHLAVRVPAVTAAVTAADTAPVAVTAVLAVTRPRWRSRRSSPRRRPRWTWRARRTPPRQAPILPQEKSLQILRRENGFHRLQARRHPLAIRAGARQNTPAPHDRRLLAPPALARCRH